MPRMRLPWPARRIRRTQWTRDARRNPRTARAAALRLHDRQLRDRDVARGRAAAAHGSRGRRGRDRAAEGSARDDAARVLPHDRRRRRSRHDQGCRRRSGRHAWRADLRARRARGGARRALSCRAGRRHGHARGADAAGRRTGDQSGAAPDDDHAPGGACGRARLRGRLRRDDRRRRRRGARAEDDEPAAGHRRRAVDPRHDRHRAAVLVFGLYRVDSSGHRRRARERHRAHRGLHGQRQRGRDARALPAARHGADRDGRFRGRGAQASAARAGRAPVDVRRLRQAEQARGRPSRSAQPPFEHRPAAARAMGGRSRCERRAAGRDARGEHEPGSVETRAGRRRAARRSGLRASCCSAAPATR